MNTLNKLIATFFFTGMSSFAPGTFGTIGAVVLYWGLWQLDFINTLTCFVCLILASVGNIYIGRWAEEYFGTKDSKHVVIDEVAGFFLTIIWFKPSYPAIIFAFLLFRLFDITKIYPMKKLEKYPYGYGVLMDDLVAGLYAAGAMIIISYVCFLAKIELGVNPSLWMWS